MKNTIAVFSLLVLLVAGISVMVYTHNEAAPTYDGAGTDVTELYENPEDYDVEGASGIAEIIVDTNLDKTMAVNDVASVAFDYRGFDTIGESFILLSAIAGSFVIIRMIKKREEE